MAIFFCEMKKSRYFKNILKKYKKYLIFSNF
nr:MAG TPA: hypothetical protein [Caudoviricetes sp.]DAX39919.1 MAG TPA: hypothetical protein [Caudoviricetes sp.]